MKNQVSKETLFNYFAGRATALQKQAIDEWAREESNREFFFECLASWESQNPQFMADANVAFKRHQQRMAVQQNIHVQSQESSWLEPRVSWLSDSRFRWMIAASVSAVLLLLGGLLFKDTLLFATHRTAFGETRSLTLDDGSHVTLNANSSLRVPRFGFGRKTRHVALVGEADFDIKHLIDDQPFVVQTNKNFEVLVLGTQFLVNTREQGTKVVLNKGKVRLRYQEGTTSKQLTMKPGNLVTFDQKGHISLRQTPKPQDYTSWKEHRFVFDGTTLAEISGLFAANYGIQVQIPDKALTQWAISGSFTAYSAAELMETLASASNLSYRQQGDTIIITQAH
jgi:transmembrane sensor